MLRPSLLTVCHQLQQAKQAKQNEKKSTSPMHDLANNTRECGHQRSSATLG